MNTTTHSINILQTQLSQLNNEQYNSVVHTGSPLLILAGPGSGKTKVITTKIAWLIKEINIEPSKILAMTFTNKAAKEMKQRVHDSIQTHIKYIEQPFISTFHSFGAYILRLFHDAVGLARTFQIYDINDQKTLIKEALPSIDSKIAENSLRKISTVKERGITPQSNDPLIDDIKLDRHHYRAYEEAKQKTGNVDFGDLLLKPYLLFRENKEILKTVHTMWQWYLIDEYQDTNTIQFLLLDLLCSHTANICVVGDDDQSIYKFRGAIVENILTFTSHFTNASLIQLKENYRSTNQIIQLANNVVSHNQERHTKEIYSNLQDGDKPEIIYFSDENQERQYITMLAQSALETNRSLGVFFRLNSLSRGYETTLIQAGIPYEIVGAISFYDREEVKDALALLRILKNNNDFINVQRIINKPKRGIGTESIKKIVEIMKEGKSWLDIVQDESLLSTLTKKSQEGLIKFRDIFISSTDKSSSIGECLTLLLEKSGLKEYHHEQDIQQGTDKMRNLEEIISFASDFKLEEIKDNNNEEDTLKKIKNNANQWSEFFEQISLVEQGTRTHNAPIHLMSLHRSKGLEFDMVLICGIEEGILPYERSYEIPDYEEERRLFYVGVTRAKIHLVLSACSQRRQYGQVQYRGSSFFLDQIDKSLVYEHTCQIKDDNDSTYYNSVWQVGQQVYHDEYGNGYIKNVKHTSKHEIVEVEFANNYEALFIPKYTPKLRIKNEE